MATVKDFYNALDKFIPFSNLQNGDNSGILIGDEDEAVTKVIVTLDITMEIITEAIRRKANLIIAHHPVIYNPLYRLSTSEPAGYALVNGINCICIHSPLDMADGGINDIIHSLLKEPLGLSERLAVLEPVHKDGRGYGMVCDCDNPLYPNKMAELLKDVFGCTIVRYTNAGVPIKRLAFCSGGGGKLFRDAFEMGCDGYISGDFKHDQFVDSGNIGISLFDCGHYHTEDIGVSYMQRELSKAFPEISIEKGESDVDPVNYLV